MAEVILLDSAPVGLITNPKATPIVLEFHAPETRKFTEFASA